MGFRRYHAVDVSRWNGDAGSAEIDGIVRGVVALAGQAPPAPRALAAGVQRSARLTRRQLLVAATGTALVGASGLVAWRRGWFDPLSLAAANSVAVLPFSNLSGDQSQAYFSDGLAEEVRATLARNARLQVMAQTSSAKFRDRTEDAQSIASKLGVAYLLDGSVRRAGDVVRVAVDLVEGRSGFSRWSQTFDRPINDIFAVQSEIARAVATALVARVRAEGEPPASGGTTSVPAFDAYLRGRALYNLSVDEASERAALAQFDAAIAADPNYAAAHAARARTLTTIANQYGQVDRVAALYVAAIAAAERAIALAPELADAHSTLGFTLFQGRLDARSARAPFERSIQIGSGEATVAARYALYCARTGRDAAAVPAMQRAVLLDPLNPLIHRAAGSVEYAARRYGASIGPLRQALKMNSRMSRAHAEVGDALLMQGRLADARAEYALEPSGDFRLAGQAIVEHAYGNDGESRAAMSKLIAGGGDRVLYQQGQVLAQWGEPAEALARLERARQLGDTGLIYARNDPMLDPLRGEPRFSRLLTSIGFE
jgi:TolB-like protein/tetratricopeptide (TPR) repeat protein